MELLHSMVPASPYPFEQRTESAVSFQYGASLAVLKKSATGSQKREAKQYVGGASGTNINDTSNR